jgi:hypothetical protein
VNHTTDQLAALVADLFRKLGDDADIYVKYHPQDIRSLAQTQGNELNEARMKRALTIYPLANIIRETLGGATLESRFKALFTA